MIHHYRLNCKYIVYVKKNFLGKCKTIKMCQIFIIRKMFFVSSVSPELLLQYGPFAIPRGAGQHRIQGGRQEEYAGFDR